MENLSGLPPAGFTAESTLEGIEIEWVDPNRELAGPKSCRYSVELFQRANIKSPDSMSSTRACAGPARPVRDVATAKAVAMTACVSGLSLISVPPLINGEFSLAVHMIDCDSSGSSAPPSI